MLQKFFSIKNLKILFLRLLELSFIVLFSIILFSSSIFSYPKGTRTISLNSSQAKLVGHYWIGNYDYYSCTGFGIGRHDGYFNSNSTNDISRKAFIYDVSQIYNSSIYHVEFTVSFYDPLNHNGVAKISTYTSETDDCADILGYCNGSDVIDGYVEYPYANNPYTGNSNAISSLQSAVTSGHNYRIGTMSGNEATNNTDVNLSVSIFVVYYPATYPVTVRNSFNGGTVTIDGTPQSAGTGISNNWARNSSHTITAIDQQIYGNYIYVFNHWQDKNGNTDNSLSKTITIDDDNTWTAVFDQKCLLTVQNDFGGGYVLIDGVSLPSPGTKIVNVGAQVTFAFIPNQIYANYKRLFKNWNDANTDQSRTLPININSIYSISTHKEFNIVFVNSGNGNIIVNGTSFSSPTLSFPVEETHTITAQSEVPPPITGREWWFINWSDGWSVNPHTFTPIDHATYTATYWAYLVPIDPYITGNIGDPVTVNWNNHPSPDVTTYEVWRSAGWDGSPQALLATLNKPDSSYTDWTYTITPVIKDKDIQYWVIGKTSQGEGSTPHTVGVYASNQIKAGKTGGVNENLSPESEKVIPKDYAIQNYPNPFNPTTTFNIQLPNPEVVKLKIFDAMGREVSVLVDRYLNAGIYNFDFKAGNIPSGMYFYNLKAGKYLKTGKILLMK